MDIVKQIAEVQHRPPMVITGDDPSLGIHLRQLVMQDGDFLQFDDRGASSRFAMEPTCHTEGVYQPLKQTTWVVHHVSAKTIRCMFRTDLRAGYYRWRGDNRLFRPRLEEVFPSLCRCVD